MIIEQSEQIIREVSKVLIGKKDIIEKVLMTIYAGGHVLLEDSPGVGKTTLALGFSKALNLSHKRVQFTPDTMPSDITGFSIFNKSNGQFEFKEGAVSCHIFLGDEINRTSAKTQAALLEAMEEGSVTVDGVTHMLPKPFVCIATQNPHDSAGTQALPDSQLDRFMVRLSVGYPSTESQVEILRSRRSTSNMDSVRTVMTRDDVKEIQDYLYSIRVTDDVLFYLTHLCEATRTEPMVELGISPRGILALMQMARAHAMLRERDFVIPEDVQAVFIDVCAHRLNMKPQAKIEGITATDVLRKILENTPAPSLGRK